MKRDSVIKVLGYGYYKTIVTKTETGSIIKCKPIYRNVALCEIVWVLGSDTIDVYDLNDVLLEDLEKHFNIHRDEMIPLMIMFGYNVNEKEKPFFDGVENAIGAVKRNKYIVKNCENK